MSQGFRRALGGFHRDDVIAYVQKLTQDHQEECRLLREELERLNCELEALRAAASAESEPQETAPAVEVLQEEATEEPTEEPTKEPTEEPQDMPELPEESAPRYF
ncbi:MAG: hypothetical protein IIY16_02970 [Oscillospiraceae bacterium]|nr:hypothetical protein [Oscillospiraceae bacterium]